jgi:hypothetical protein
MGQFDKRPAGRIEWVKFQNNSGQDIPPFSIVEATGWSQTDPSGSDLSANVPFVLGDQPTDPIDPDNCYITGAITVLAGGYGSCARPTQTTPLLLAIGGSRNNIGDGPFAPCGPSNASWTGTRGADGFVMLAAPQNGYALVAPAQQRPQFFLTTNDGTGYPKMSTQPNVYFARKITSIQFPNIVGNQELSGTIDSQTPYYLFSDFSYLYQNTVVTAVYGLVTGIVSGSRFELGMAGTLDTLLSSGGSTTVSVTYTDSLGNNVSDHIPAIEGLGLGSSSSIASGTRVFIEWDTALYQWVVVAAACAGGTPDTPISKPRPADNLVSQYYPPGSQGNP